MNDRDRLAADLHEQNIGCEPHRHWSAPTTVFMHNKDADRLIALGWTRLEVGYVPVRLYSGGVLADGTTNTEPIDFLNPPPLTTVSDTLDEERLARALQVVGLAGPAVRGYVPGAGRARAIAKAYRDG